MFHKIQQFLMTFYYFQHELKTLKMKKVLLFSLFAVFAFSAQAVNSVQWAQQFEDAPKIQVLTPEMTKMHVDQFLSLTPKKIHGDDRREIRIQKITAAKSSPKVHEK